LHLLLILLLTFLVLTALFWGGTRLIQYALYEDAPTELFWRAPAAAGALTAFFALWCLVNYRALPPGQAELPYDGLFNFTTEKDSAPLKEFWAVRAGGAPVHYRLRTIPGTPPRHEYRDDGDVLWQTAQAREVRTIIVKEDGQDVRFDADPGKGRYVEEGGRRYIAGEALGRITTPRQGGWVLSMLLNGLHLAVWFACLWLLLRFQWPHALLGAFVLWLAMTFVVPSLLDQTPRKPAPEPTATALRSSPLSPTTGARGDDDRP
jgi:hypothetical protein